MPIKKGLVRATGYVAPTTPVGQLGSLVGGDGKYYSAWWEGATQSHPLPVGGGNYISFDSDGVQEGATGWVQDTGVVVQGSTGLVATLENGVNGDVIVDLPVFGSQVFWSALARCSATMATPVTDSRFGYTMLSSSTSTVFGIYANYSGAAWEIVIERAGVDSSGADTYTLADVGAVSHTSHPTTGFPTLFRNIAGAVAKVAEYESLAILELNSSSFETLGTPPTTTWEIRFEAHRPAGAGSDLVVTFEGMAVLANPLNISVVD